MTIDLNPYTRVVDLDLGEMGRGVLVSRQDALKIACAALADGFEPFSFPASRWAKGEHLLPPGYQLMDLKHKDLPLFWHGFIKKVDGQWRCVGFEVEA